MSFTHSFAGRGSLEAYIINVEVWTPTPLVPANSVPEIYPFHEQICMQGGYLSQHFYNSGNWILLIDSHNGLQSSYCKFLYLLIWKVV